MVPSGTESIAMPTSAPTTGIRTPLGEASVYTCPKRLIPSADRGVNINDKIRITDLYIQNNFLPVNLINNNNAIVLALHSITIESKLTQFLKNIHQYARLIIYY
jgi:hypothetical protein